MIQNNKMYHKFHRITSKWRDDSEGLCHREIEKEAKQVYQQGELFGVTSFWVGF